MTDELLGESIDAELILAIRRSDDSAVIRLLGQGADPSHRN